MSQPDPQQQDPGQEPNAAEVLGNVISGIGQLFSNIQAWIKSGAGVLTLLCVSMLGTGGIAGYFTTDLLGSSGSPISVIIDVSIEKIGTEGNPETGEDESQVHINFPDPRGPGCDRICEDEVLRVTENGTGCEYGVCIAEMRNIDQRDLQKFSTSSIHNVLDGIMKERHRVDLVVSGSRNFEDSEYPNIIRVIRR